MPTRKQRRRRQKDRRHEWEYVYVDDEGREVEVDEEPERAAAKPRPQAATAKQPAKGGTKSGGARPARKVDPPSWNRTFRRTAIMAPLMFIFVYYVTKNSDGTRSFPLAVSYTAVMLLVFVPFTYIIDEMMYRAYRKRIGDPLPPRGGKPKPPR